MAITAFTFLKIVREACPRTLLEPDFCSTICFKLTWPEKNILLKMQKFGDLFL